MRTNKSTRTAEHTLAAIRLLGLLLLAVLAGCSAWPFGKKEHTSIVTPAMRIATIREIGARANDADSQQQLLVDQLAQQIRTEPDPLVRRAIQETVADFDSPLAQSILLAGLNDTDRDVRIACCRKLGERGELATVDALKQALQQDDEDIDVRLAAVDALGKIRSSASVQALSVALHNRDPAMQYAGVQAAKSASGQDFGNDVEAWRRYADGENPQVLPAPSMASRMKEMLPF